MTLSQEEIVGALFAARSRISTAIWLVVRDTQAAEDIFQSIAVKAITKGGPFTTLAHLFSWTQVAARHAAIDWLRSQRLTRVTLDVDVLDLLEAQAQAAEPVRGARVDALRDCLESVPSHSRQMLELRYFEGRSCEEVAAALGVKLTTVYQRLSRLHRALKECIERQMQAGATALKPDPEAQ